MKPIVLLGALVNAPSHALAPRAAVGLADDDVAETAPREDLDAVDVG